MGKVTRFVGKSERERAHLVREARAIYDSIFPPSDCVSEERHNAFASQVRVGAEVDRGEGGLS
ncbi:hypothetical protein [Bradyrhizobium sp. 23AC]